MHTGELYLPNDDEIIQDQIKKLDRLYDFNMTRPTLKRPVVAASIAAGIGGIVGGLLQVSLYIAQNCIMAIPVNVKNSAVVPCQKSQG